MIECKPDGDAALLIPVRVQPGAARDEVAGEYAGSLKIKVTSPARGGRANKAVAEVLARALGVRRAQVRLVSGQKGRNKVFRVEGATEGEVQRLAAG